MCVGCVCKGMEGGGECVCVCEGGRSMYVYICVCMCKILVHNEKDMTTLYQVF